ncbi:MAG: helix-turn-helix transcriptional regulator [Thiogranum sp.]|jgi:DNA-binding CsgD family transcriptional regulator
MIVVLFRTLILTSVFHNKSRTSRGFSILDRRSQQHFVRPSSDISRYITDIYRSSRSLTISDFKHSCFDALQRIVPFDSADWATGIGAHAPARHFTRPSDGRVDSRAGRALLQCAEGLSAVAPQNPKFQQHLRTWGQKGEADGPAMDRVCDGESASGHTLTTTGFFGQAGLFTCIRIHRSNSSPVFSCQEQYAKRQLVSHIVDAYDNNLNFALLTQHSRGPAAIIDHHGVIHARSPDFDAMLREEWPQWAGCALPEELSALVGRGGAVYTGGRIMVRIKPEHKMSFVHAEKVSAGVKLTSRETTIAYYLRQGKGYKEIAQTLGISPSTVTNHVNSIYKKLNVRNKTELSLKFPNQPA